MRHDALQAKRVLRDGVELAIIGLGLDAPEAAAADVCQAGAEAVAQQAEQPEDDVTVGTRIGHDLRRLQFGLLFEHDRQQHQAVAESTGRRDRVEPGELIGEQVVPRHAFERAEVLGIGAGMHGANRHDEAHAVRGSDFAATPRMGERDAVLGGNQPGIGRRQRVVTDVVLFDPGQAVAA